MTYYNTTNETNPDLKQYRETAEKQDEVILDFFKQHKELTASDIERRSTIFITSIRRSINTLVNDGLLEMTGEKRKSPRGRPENVYRLVRAKNSQTTLF
jgi:predicted ArsR family transcriptional regulator